MRRAAWRAATVVLVAVLCASVSTAARTSRIESDHYIIETDVSPKFARVTRQHMENMLSAYRRTLPEFDSPLKHRFRVRVYRSQQAYDKVVPGMVRGSSGVFVSEKRLLAAYLGERVPESVFRTLYHEGFHQFMYQVITRDAPLWVNEGLAEYFAEATWNGEGFTLGQVPLERLRVVRRAIRRNQAVPLPQLVKMDTEKWVRSIRIDRSRASVQYGQVWSFIHFLLHADGGRHRSRLMGYLEALSRGRAPEKAFREHFGGDMRGLQREWKRYVFRLRPSHKSVCKRNLQVLMTMALEIWDEPRKVKDVAALSGLLLEDENLQWSATGPYGTRYSSEDRVKAAELFTCGADQSPADASYRIVRVNNNGPAIYCTNHPGIILRAYMERAGGRYRVRVEERIQDTLNSDTKQALRLPAK